MKKGGSTNKVSESKNHVDLNRYGNRILTSIDKNTDFESFIELCRLSFGEGVTVDPKMYDWYFNRNPYNPPGTNMMYVLKERSEKHSVSADGAMSAPSSAPVSSSSTSAQLSSNPSSGSSLRSAMSCDTPSSDTSMYEKVIAADGLFPFELCVGGKKYKAAHSVQSMTHPDYKRQGIFRTMTEHSLAKAKEHGLDIVLGLANGNSYGAYEKFGWKTLFEKRIHIRPVHIYTRLRRNLRITLLSGLIASGYYIYDGVRRMLQAGKTKGYTTSVLDSVPNSVSECFERYKEKFGALIVRDFVYLDYRYNQRPDRKYKTIVLQRKGRADNSKADDASENSFYTENSQRAEYGNSGNADSIEGFAVVRVCDLVKNKMLTVAEFFCNPDDEQAIHALVKSVVDYGYATGVEYIVLSIGGNRNIRDVLAKTGFKRNTKPLLNNMMIAQDVSGRLSLDSLADEAVWMITQGDGEAELHI